MTVTSPYEVVSTALEQIINDEFAAEGFVAIHDNLHESLGRDRVEIGIAPDEDSIPASSGAVMETLVSVKFYGLWTQEISPTTVVDPRIIANYAERFRRACQRSSARDGLTGSMWYFDVRRIRYTDDPTGNKTRFVASIRSFSNNSGLVETTG